MEAIQQRHRLGRPIDQVWRAWSEPGWLAGWHAERVEGELAAGRSIELAWDSLGVSVDLEVSAVEPPGRLVLRGSRPGRPPQTLAIELAPDGQATWMTIRHDGFPAGPAGEEERAGTAAGWHTSARILEHYLAHHAGRARACAAALATAGVPLAAVGPAIAAPGWLAPGLVIGPEGSPVTLAAGGAPLSGRVLSHALPRQVALSVAEAAAVIVIRAIRLHEGATLVGPLAWSWQPERPAWRALEEELAPATARLLAALGGGGAAA